MPHLPGLLETYRRRRDRIMEVFWEAGWKVDAPKGALYVWLPTPPGESSVDFTARLLDEAGVVVAPGTGYGPRGKGYIRLSIPIPDSAARQCSTVSTYSVPLRKHVRRGRLSTFATSAGIVATFSSCSRTKVIPAFSEAGINVSVAGSPENNPGPTTETSREIVRW